MIDAQFTLTQGSFTLEIDLLLPAKGIIGLCGASGSGKSTFFNCLAGHVHPDSGHIRIGGHSHFDATRGRFLAPAARNIGVAFQDALLFPHMTVRRNLFYGAGPGSDDLAATIIRDLDIAHLLDAKPKRLSGGERQRVAIGRALMAQPDLLLLDEPVSALDPDLRARTLDLIAAVQADTDTPMIYISHAPEEMRRLCGPIVTMDQGRIVQIADEPAPRRARLQAVPTTTPQRMPAWAR